MDCLTLVFMLLLLPSESVIGQPPTPATTTPTAATTPPTAATTAPTAATTLPTVATTAATTAPTAATTPPTAATTAPAATTTAPTTATTAAPAGGGPNGGPAGPPEYSTDLEKGLRESLYRNYDIMQRPEKKVLVKGALNLLSIIHMNIKDQELALSGYLTLDWLDSRLSWDDEDDYSNVPFLFNNEETLWRPSIILENAVDNIDVISKPNVLMRIRSDGRIVWTPGGVYVTHCDCDVTYYPLDTQYCDIILSTWSYTANEVFLNFTDEPIVMDYFKEHGEWEVIGLTYEAMTSKRESQSFSRLMFTLALRRRPLFHILNTIFPVILMAFLTVIVFKLPVESGERIGLSLTILLAYAVYLTLISDNIPQTSLSASLLSTYLAVILLLSTFSVILTIFVLDIYFTPAEKKVPRWLNILTGRVLVKVTCWKRENGDQEFISKISRFASHSHSTKPEPEMQEKPRQKSPRPVTPRNVCVTGINEKRPVENGWTSPDDDFDDSSYTDDHDEKYTWKEIAIIIDKMFLYIFLFLVTSATSICMGMISAHYNTSY